MLKFARAAAALSFALLLAHPAGAAAPSNAPEPSNAAGSTTVKVALLDMTALFGPGEGTGFSGYGPGMMGQGYGGYGPGMMGQGDGPGYGPGMMGQGYGHGPGYMGRGYGMHGMMGMMSVRTNVASVKAGKVTFDVSNLSRSIVHEMLVIAVDNPNTPLPYDYSTGQVDEKQVKVLGETEDMQPNAEKEISMDLTPGSYLLICNVPGHYASGMWTPLTVN